ncbi:MAG: hypothetical protein C7B45_17600 [Sulfobacillus acidophilus]|uniref:Uncharacterized protein n=1 Tax=Sulfobacillus acidophilus TaxID=53633 RepID=A0A2T2WCE6_9FIRM|nr:MAG: hypothetical protein C7B45_17600 [Sulfobacillus acidophilus]
MDGKIDFDFPAADCTFIFTDGTALVAQAPAANQQLRDCHIFTSDDGKHFALGQPGPFNEQAGWLFIQQRNSGVFNCTSGTPITNNVGQQQVPSRYHDA